VAIAAANGLDPAIAVDMINKSSGRNNATMTVFPNNIFTDNFEARFTMALMEKDVALAAELAGNGFEQLTLTPLILRNYRMGIERFGHNGDIHDMLRFYEEAAQVKIAKKPL
jgi:3-hydroxyisobutyrate dehydrogenase